MCFLCRSEGMGPDARDGIPAIVQYLQPWPRQSERQWLISRMKETGVDRASAVGNDRFARQAIINQYGDFASEFVATDLCSYLPQGK